MSQMLAYSVRNHKIHRGRNRVYGDAMRRNASRRKILVLPRGHETLVPLVVVSLAERSGFGFHNAVLFGRSFEIVCFVRCLFYQGKPLGDRLSKIEHASEGRNLKPSLSFWLLSSQRSGIRVMARPHSSCHLRC